MDPTYSATQVCALAGVSYRRLDYWVRQGYLGDVARLFGAHPKGPGNPRRFTEAHVQRCREIKDAFDQAAAILEGAGLEVAESLRGGRH